jgi:hypothetical protein
MRKRPDDDLETLLEVATELEFGFLVATEATTVTWPMTKKEVSIIIEALQAVIAIRRVMGPLRDL